MKICIVVCRGCFDVCEVEDDIGDGSSSSRGSNHSDLDPKSHRQTLTSAMDREAGRDHTGDSGPGVYISNSSALGCKKSPSGSLLQENVLSPKKIISDGDRYILHFELQLNNSFLTWDISYFLFLHMPACLCFVTMIRFVLLCREYLQPRFTNERNYSGPMQYRQKKDLSNSTSGKALMGTW